MIAVKERGFTLAEMTVFILILGVVTAFSVSSLKGPKEALELRAVNEQGMDLANYVEKLRKTPIGTAAAPITYPGGGVYTHSYMVLPADSTVEDFNTEVIDQHGFAPEFFPAQTPFETPYLITMTATTSYVETTIPGTDLDLSRASETVDAGETTFRFYPSVDSEGNGTSRAAPANFTKAFMMESVR